MKFLLSSLLIFAICSSCSTKFSIQKRKYSKGFYFASAKSKKGTSVYKLLEKKKEQVIAREAISLTVAETELKTETELSKKTEIDLAKSENLISESTRLNDCKLSKENYKPLDFSLNAVGRHELKIRNTEIVQKAAPVNFLTALLGLVVFALGLYVVFWGFVAFILLVAISPSLLPWATLLGLLIVIVGIVICFFAIKLIS